jgi:hypothetical protein
MGSNPGRHSGKPATNRLSYDAATITVIVNESRRSRDSSVGIATSYGLDDREVRVRVQTVQTGSGVHPTSYPMGSGGYFPGGKDAGA